MGHAPGSVPYLEELALKKLKIAQARMEQIEAIGTQNFQDWPTMTDPQKDAANRAAQKGIAEIAEALVIATRYLLRELRD